MKFYFLFFVAIFYSSCDAQKTGNNLKQEEIVDEFVRYFNGSYYKEIYNLFNPKMKKRNSVDKIEANLGKLRMAIGKIIKIEFIGKKADAHMYKTRLEKGTITLSLSFDDQGYLTAMSIDSYGSNRKPLFKLNTTSLILPFKDEWYVFWGGSTVSQNYHNSYPSMFGAYDFWVMGSNGKSHRTDGKKNEDYYAFGKEIIAPCDGTVVMVIDGIKDNIWPAMNRDQGGGNTVIIKTDKKEYLQFAHLMHESIVVQQNQRIKQGEKIGLCGNSGLSTEPHLHFQLQDSDDLISTKGVRSFFEEIYANGEIKKNYSPKKGDKVNNIQ